MSKLFIRCLEKFMRFINRNAYIVCAMKSTNFCSSAQTAFNLWVNFFFWLTSIKEFIKIINMGPRRSTCFLRYFELFANNSTVYSKTTMLIFFSVGPQVKKDLNGFWYSTATLYAVWLTNNYITFLSGWCATSCAWSSSTRSSPSFSSWARWSSSPASDQCPTLSSQNKSQKWHVLKFNRFTIVEEAAEVIFGLILSDRNLVPVTNGFNNVSYKFTFIM